MFLLLTEKEGGYQGADLLHIISVRSEDSQLMLIAYLHELCVACE
jgi:hypothetical protein